MKRKPAAAANGEPLSQHHAPVGGFISKVKRVLRPVKRKSAAADNASEVIIASVDGLGVEDEDGGGHSKKPTSQLTVDSLLDRLTSPRVVLTIVAILLVLIVLRVAVLLGVGNMGSPSAHAAAATHESVESLAITSEYIASIKAAYGADTFAFPLPTPRFHVHFVAIGDDVTAGQFRPRLYGPAKEFQPYHEQLERSLRNRTRIEALVRKEQRRDREKKERDEERRRQDMADDDNALIAGALSTTALPSALMNVGGEDDIRVVAGVRVNESESEVAARLQRRRQRAYEEAVQRRRRDDAETFAQFVGRVDGTHDSYRLVSLVGSTEAKVVGHLEGLVSRIRILKEGEEEQQNQQIAGSTSSSTSSNGNSHDARRLVFPPYSAATSRSDGEGEGRPLLRNSRAVRDLIRHVLGPTFTSHNVERLLSIYNRSVLGNTLSNGLLPPSTRKQKKSKVHKSTAAVAAANGGVSAVSAVSTDGGVFVPPSLAWTNQVPIASVTTAAVTSIGATSALLYKQMHGELMPYASSGPLYHGDVDGDGFMGFGEGEGDGGAINGGEGGGGGGGGQQEVHRAINHRHGKQNGGVGNDRHGGGVPIPEAPWLYNDPSEVAQRQKAAEDLANRYKHAKPSAKVGGWSNVKQLLGKLFAERVAESDDWPGDHWLRHLVEPWRYEREAAEGQQQPPQPAAASGGASNVNSNAMRYHYPFKTNDTVVVMCGVMAGTFDAFTVSTNLEAARVGGGVVGGVYDGGANEDNRKDGNEHKYAENPFIHRDMNVGDSINTLARIHKQCMGYFHHRIARWFVEEVRLWNVKFAIPPKSPTDPRLRKYLKQRWVQRSAVHAAMADRDALLSQQKEAAERQRQRRSSRKLRSGGDQAAAEAEADEALIARPVPPVPQLPPHLEIPRYYTDVTSRLERLEEARRRRRGEAEASDSSSSLFSTFSLYSDTYIATALLPLLGIRIKVVAMPIEHSGLALDPRGAVMRHRVLPLVGEGANSPLSAREVGHCVHRDPSNELHSIDGGVWRSVQSHADALNAAIRQGHLHAKLEGMVKAMRWNDASAPHHSDSSACGGGGAAGGRGFSLPCGGGSVSILGAPVSFVVSPIPAPSTAALLRPRAVVAARVGEEQGPLPDGSAPTAKDDTEGRLWLWSDCLHLTPDGYNAVARLVSNAAQRLVTALAIGEGVW